jgi:predicted NAD/FAD-dependent oxidoreductase
MNPNTYSTHNTQIKRVAVIGAGIAGLSCASQLQSFGMSIDVFEKSRGPSGRMSTRRTPEWSADHGAQYFTARDPRFIQEVERWIRNGVADLWNPRLMVYEAGVWDKSHSQETRYVGTPNMTSPGKFLAKDLSIQYEKTISQLERSGDQWSLQCNEASDISVLYDFVVLAIPAPQANTLLKNIDSRASKITNSAQMKACWTMMGYFPNQGTANFDAAFINQEIISWICQNGSKPLRQGRQMWTIHGNPSWSQVNVELSKEAAQSQMMECLAGIGFDCRDSEISMHRWRYASGALESPIHFLLLPDLNLGLCGDWLHGGRVEGSYLSGLQLAEAIIKSRES